ncbi:MAG: AMP-binding protein [Anaerolineales bacterium]|nr:AMP-binding protein [Anaerolineales bacterium]
MGRYQIEDYAALLRRARDDIEWFWNAVLDDLSIEFYKPYTQVVDLSSGNAFPRWCVDGEMNIVHNLLDKWQRTPVREQAALHWEGEEGAARTLTYRELYVEVNRCANALRGIGLGKGDLVGLYMPMIPELAIAFLAVIKIGGIILPLFSGYGPAAIEARLVDAQASAVIAADGIMRRGQPVPMKSVLDEALAGAPSVRQVVVVERVGVASTPMVRGRDLWWHDLIPRQPAEAATEVTGAEDVLMVIYTSGTTGKPKGAVHTHCGFPIKAAQDMRQCMDLKMGEAMFWLTDMGWMMGPWLVFGALLNGASMVFYDGAPDFPGPDRLWSLVAQHRVTHLGITPSLMRALRAHGDEPVHRHSQASLRAIGSTGSPWDPESWLWTFETVLGGEKPILNYSGGTEISGGILCGNFLTPNKPCAFSGPVPGMDADVVDEEGNPVRGVVGELVIRQPWIGMTRGFWGDRERYFTTYWGKIPGMWVHGDFAAIDEEELWYILGRSDDTIKVAGKRLGPAEVEAILNGYPAVLESAAIGVPHPVKDQEVVAFCVLRTGYSASDELRAALIGLVAEQLGKPLKPRDIRFVTTLPKTRNAKVMHRVIRAAYLGQPLGDLTSLESAAAVDAVKHSQ